MTFELHDIHVWLVDLTNVSAQQATLLSPDEHARAERFLQPVHRERFIAARSNLRMILSLYTDTPAEAIQFSYSEHHKPFLTTPTNLEFNLAHSEDIALVAVTKQHPIGIDIEKMTEKNLLALATRFFNAQETAALRQLPTAAQAAAFYRLWSRKEALIKAAGKGLSIPLTSFAVASDERLETIMLENTAWSLVSFPVHADFQSALATSQPITTLSLWRLIDHVPTLEKVYKW